MATKINLRLLWMRLYKSSGFHKSVTFLIFVAIAAVFWFVLALNDNIQDNIEVRINIENVPDSVTFINLPPERVHVTVRDKGTNLLRTSLSKDAVMNFNFREYDDDGVFRVSRSELDGVLKNTFGSSATIMSCGIDSLRCYYTTLPGKRLPIDLLSSLTPAPGKVIKSVTLNPSFAIAYSDRSHLDTLNRVRTHNIIQRGLEESTTLKVDLRSMSGVRIEPSRVVVNIVVEPLVRKEALLHVTVENAPDNIDLLLFPSRVNVEYYTPMSKYNQPVPDIELWVDYRDIDPQSKTLKIHAGELPPHITNLNLKESEVEYVIAHQ